MIVYEPHHMRAHQWVFPLVSADHELFRKLPAERVGDRWKPVRVELASPEEGVEARRADMPWLGSYGLVVTDRARPVLEEALADDVEFLPLVCDEEDLWLVHACRVVDALDEERSALKRFPSTGRVMRVMRYAFREEVVGGLRCFRIPQRVAIFVTDDVVASAHAAGLTGVRFRPVWDSASPPSSETSR
jgi:hypothetical protein